MKQMIFLGIFFISAYLLQTFFSVKQINEFNKIYSSMRKKGKVAIGRCPGKIKAGALVLIGLNNCDTITNVKILQGISVFTRFKDLHYLNGLNIKDEKTLNEVIKDKNKITRYAIEDAVRIFKKVNAGEYDDTPAKPPVERFVSNLFNKRSV